MVEISSDYFLIDTSDSDDHFEDARSGMEQSALNSPVVSVTKVEKVDTEPGHGEVPGTERAADAEPNQVAVNPGELLARLETVSNSRPSTPGGRPIPTTVVEKLDPDTPSHGEVPGTPAHEMRMADAVPDIVIRASPRGSRTSSISSMSRSRAGSTPGDRPIPKTKVERIDSKPSHGEVPGTEAYEKRAQDAQPDIIEEVGDIQGTDLSPSHMSSEPLTESGSPTSKSVRSSSISTIERNPSSTSENPTQDASTSLEYNEEEDGEAGGGFGDDFDDFEEGGDADFGDFDDGFQEPEAMVSPTPQSLPTVSPSFVSRIAIDEKLFPNATVPCNTSLMKVRQPIPDFDNLDSLEEVLEATAMYMDALYPPNPDESNQNPASNPSTENTVFLTQRSASLWSQLVAPPPLQPPDWIRSRIRRLFLVSLGVPVDLDEILPASKQKKLILPSIHLHSSTSPRNSLDSKGLPSRLKQTESSTSVDSQGVKKSSSRRKGPPPPPELDLVAARQLCMVTDEALNGMTEEELKDHVEKLKVMEGTAKEVLEYWTKSTDEKLGDREAFEGVIENLVKHARKTRK